MENEDKCCCWYSKKETFRPLLTSHTEVRAHTHALRRKKLRKGRAEATLTADSGGDRGNSYYILCMPFSGEAGGQSFS